MVRSTTTNEFKSSAQVGQWGLGSNALGDDGLVQLTSALKRLYRVGAYWYGNARAITGMYISGNGVGLYGAHAVADMLLLDHARGYGVRRLDLSNNCLGDDGASEIAVALRTSTTLQVPYYCQRPCPRA